MIIGLNAGHCLIGSVGARGIVASGKEEIETRAIVKLMTIFLEKLGHTVINCSIDEAYNDDDLDMIVAKANKQKLDLFVSVHLNAYKDYTANGTETYIAINSGGMYVSQDSFNRNYSYAKNVNDKLVKLGLTNRGVKQENFRVISKTNCHAILVETCFITSPVDKGVYNVEKFAKAIVEGITGQVVELDEKPPVEPKDKTYYRVIAGSFEDRANAEIMKKQLEKMGIKGVFLQAFIK